MKPEQNLNLLARSQHGVVSLDQLASCGIGRHRVRSWVRSGRLVRVHAGVFVLGGVPRTFLARLKAALLAAGPRAVASHVAAAHLLRLGDLAPRVEITVPRGANPRLRRPVHVHRVRRLDAEDTITRDGFTLTPAARTLLDLSGCLDRDAIELLLDRALVRRLVTRDELVAALGRAGQGRRGVAALRVLLAERPDGEARVESPAEQRLHRLLRGAGMAGWDPNARIVLPCGRAVRIDIAFAGARLALEVDGYRWHASASDWSNDLERRNAMIAAGWRVLPLAARSIQERPEEVAALVRRALAT